MVADFVDGENAGVVEASHGLGFAPEALAHGGLVDEVRQEHFDSHGPLGAELGGLVDDAHAAAGQFAGEAVAGELHEGGAGARRRFAGEGGARGRVAEQAGGAQAKEARAGEGRAAVGTAVGVLLRADFSHGGGPG